MTMMNDINLNDMKNTKPRPIKQKPIIKGHIKTFLSMFRPGDQLRSEDIVKYCKRNMGKQLYPDTILRYCRELRQDGLINFTCTNKQDRIYMILENGAAHSR